MSYLILIFFNSRNAIIPKTNVKIPPTTLVRSAYDASNLNGPYEVNESPKRTKSSDKHIPNNAFRIFEGIEDSLVTHF